MTRAAFYAPTRPISSVRPSSVKRVVVRGHGSTVTAPSLPLVVYRDVYAELNARYQSEAMRHGPITALTAEEAAACVASIEAQVHRPWEL